MSLIWSISASDSLGCAGIQADLRAALAQDIHCATLLSGVTAQNQSSCLQIEAISPTMFRKQWQALAGEQIPDAIKIGMLPSLEIIHELRKCLEGYQGSVVLDPVAATSSGGEALDSEGMAALHQLLPHISLVTPNLVEASALLGYPLDSADKIRQGSMDLLKLGAKAVLLKGGHSQDGEDSTDYYRDENRGVWLTSPRLEGKFRGTGCYLATAITCSIAKGMTIREAVVHGRIHLMNAMADSYTLGDQQVLKEKQSPSKLPKLEVESSPFASIGDEAIGFYPVLPSVEWLRRLLPLGVSTAQIRIKDLEGEALKKALTEAIELGRNHGCRLFINDFWQLAIELGAYGVHLGQEDLDEADLHAIAKGGLRLGISTHSLEELARADSIYPSYLALGPIFETTCKSMAFGPQGIEKVGQWVRLSRAPVVAIGGLKPEHAADILAQGASGCALISDVTEASDPEARARQWLDLMEN